MGDLGERFFGDEVLLKPIEEITPDFIADQLKQAMKRGELFKIDFPSGWLSAGDPSFQGFIWRLPDNAGFRAQFVFKYMYAGVEYAARIVMDWSYTKGMKNPTVSLTDVDIEPVPMK